MPNASVSPQPTNKPAPTAEELALKARCQGIQAKINELRGFALKKTGDIINESTVIKKHLAPDPTWDDARIERVHAWLVANHWKYKSAGGRGDAGARAIWEEAERADVAMQPPRAAAAPEPEATIWTTMKPGQFAAEFYPSEAEKRRMYASTANA
jgi:hypothetical protein